MIAPMIARPELADGVWSPFVEIISRRIDTGHRIKPLLVRLNGQYSTPSAPTCGQFRRGRDGSGAGRGV
jgi:hypothetical protein